MTKAPIGPCSGGLRPLFVLAVTASAARVVAVVTIMDDRRGHAFCIAEGPPVLDEINPKSVAARRLRAAASIRSVQLLIIILVPEKDPLHCLEPQEYRLAVKMGEGTWKSENPGFILGSPQRPAPNNRE